MTLIILSQIVIILFFHWFADFILQTHEMAINKSKSNYWLTKHVMSYMTGILPIALLVMYLSGSFVGAFLWWMLNGGLHWVTDYNTSRWTSKLWAKQETHNFFIVIGLDQFIHYICLIGTYTLLT